MPAVSAPIQSLRSLSGGSFRFQMALRPGAGTDIFGPTPDHAAVMAERRKILAESPSDHVGALPGTEALLTSAAAMVERWLAADASPRAPLPILPAQGAAPSTLIEWCITAGRAWEPDWVLMRRDADGVFRLVAGVVCFPSGWALPDKIGRPIDEIHAPVPGLNAALGAQIHAFLDKLKPNAVWVRDNWGLSADSALNHHPALHHCPLSADARLTSTWLRYEEQCLAQLPGSRDVLFGIRVGCVRLVELVPLPEITNRLADALRTMPDDVAVYKGLAQARPALLAELE